jgi:endoglucanase
LHPSGPNSGIQDEVAQAKLHGCPPQFCYIDDVHSWSTNELTINWNSSRAWISSFIADQPRDGDPNNGKAADVTGARVNSTPAG